jgi:hypothetical protein
MILDVVELSTFLYTLHCVSAQLVFTRKAGFYCKTRAGSIITC